MSLSANWFSEGLLDFEYKQYLLLGYLNGVQRLFEQSKVYPALGDLVGHYRTLTDYRTRKAALGAALPRRITGIDWQALRLQYEPAAPELAPLAEVDAIVDYAIPRVQGALEAGRALYEEVDARLVLTPVGVMPLYKLDGYVLVRAGAAPEVAVFRYRVSVFSPVGQAPLPVGPGQAPAAPGERLRAIALQPLGTLRASPLGRYESLKLELVRRHEELPNPATYLCESEWQLPLEETLLPIAKRRLLREVA